MQYFTLSKLILGLSKQTKLTGGKKIKVSVPFLFIQLIFIYRPFTFYRDRNFTFYVKNNTFIWAFIGVKFDRFVRLID